MQVWLPTATKANTAEAGADVKERGLFKCQPPENMGDPHPKVHLHISVLAEAFIRRELESRTKRSKGGVEKFSA